MRCQRRKREGERGAALVEFSIGAVVFLTAIFAVLEFGILLWTHNALTLAARRGARYAVNQTKSDEDIERVKNVVIYGEPDPASTVKPLVNGLTVDNVKVEHPGFGLGEGTVVVRIENYDFNFVVPLLGTKVRMPEYRTALPGESAGLVPSTID